MGSLIGCYRSEVIEFLVKRLVLSVESLSLELCEGVSAMETLAVLPEGRYMTGKVVNLGLVVFTLQEELLPESGVLAYGSRESVLESHLGGAPDMFCRQVGTVGKITVGARGRGDAKWWRRRRRQRLASFNGWSISAADLAGDRSGRGGRPQRLHSLAANSRDLSTRGYYRVRREENKCPEKVGFTKGRTTEDRIEGRRAVGVYTR